MDYSHFNSMGSLILGGQQRTEDGPHPGRTRRALFIRNAIQNNAHYFGLIPVRELQYNRASCCDAQATTEFRLSASSSKTSTSHLHCSVGARDLSRFLSVGFIRQAGCLSVRGHRPYHLSCWC